MNYTFAQYQESADYIRSQIGGFAPKVAMILGSGLGYMGDIVENPIAVPYQNIPHAPGGGHSGLDGGPSSGGAPHPGLDGGPAGARFPGRGAAGALPAGV